MEPLGPAWSDYALLDSGDGAKLERFGIHTVVREELLAKHTRTLPPSEWDKADAIHTEDDGWQLNRETPENWPIQFGPLTLKIRPASGFKHVGLFPEQAPQWQWLLDRKIPRETEQPRLLNLFGHTGAASLAAAKAGYAVTHVDSSKPALNLARENQKLSNLVESPIRWIHEDATKFVEREQKRGNLYHAILLDPPAFGRGPKGQAWQIEKDLPPLLKKLVRLLEKPFHFLFLNLYAGDFSIQSLKHLLENKGNIEHGNFTLNAENGPTLKMSNWLRLE